MIVKSSGSLISRTILRKNSYQSNAKSYSLSPNSRKKWHDFHYNFLYTIFQDSAKVKILTFDKSMLEMFWHNSGYWGKSWSVPNFHLHITRLSLVQAIFVRQSLILKGPKTTQKILKVFKRLQISLIQLWLKSIFLLLF